MRISTADVISAGVFGAVVGGVIGHFWSGKPRLGAVVGASAMIGMNVVLTLWIRDLLTQDEVEK